ncbi:hypothetical protein SMICM17S_04970 [Streptomyces microflavus]
MAVRRGGRAPGRRPRAGEADRRGLAGIHPAGITAGDHVAGDLEESPFSIAVEDGRPRRRLTPG